MRGRAIFAGVLSLILAGPVFANQRVYEGTEASALRCANTIALTAVALSAAERIGEPEKEVLLGVTVLILENHVSGTWREKKAAMAVMRDRRSVEDTLDDYKRNAGRCLRRFPIN
jgi:hypothetical protein